MVSARCERKLAEPELLRVGIRARVALRSTKDPAAPAVHVPVRACSILLLATAGCSSVTLPEPPVVPTGNDECTTGLAHPPGELQVIAGHVMERDGSLIVESPSIQRGERYVAIDDRGWAGMVVIEEPIPDGSFETPEGVEVFDHWTGGSWARWIARLPCPPIASAIALVGPTSTDWPKARALSGMDFLGHDTCPPRPPPAPIDGGTGLISTMGDPGPALTVQWRTDLQIDLDGDGRTDLEARARACLGQHEGLYPRAAIEWRAHDARGWRVTERFFVVDRSH
jgi:hypothetical protein